jgi:hypothetical protein
MAAPTLNSVSPAFGPPGTAIACLGAGFDTGAQVGCPALVDTTFVSAGELHAVIPADLALTEGGSVSVYVQNEDGARSAIAQFTITQPAYPVATLQSWTNIDAVCGEVPGFKRGGRIQDTTIEGWMRSIAQSIAGAMLRRGLSLKPSDWQQPDASTSMPTPAGVLELINRLGAASRLAATVAGEFTQGEWGLAKALTRDFERELKALQDGGYDRMFRPGAATVETGQQFAGGDIVNSGGDAENAFSKDQIF